MTSPSSWERYHYPPPRTPSCSGTYRPVKTSIPWLDDGLVRYRQIAFIAILTGWHSLFTLWFCSHSRGCCSGRSLFPSAGIAVELGTSCLVFIGLAFRLISNVISALITLVFSLPSRLLCPSLHLTNLHALSICFGTELYERFYYFYGWKFRFC